MTSSVETIGQATDIDALERILDVQGKFLIDAGCGDMHLSRALAERGASVLAIDPDPIQAQKNREAPVFPNVGFAECGAQAIPVENHSVDGVVFPYSLHHVPSELYAAVFAEMLRVLTPDGFLYILEPIAAGELNEVMRLFHDEQQVRAEAQSAIEKLARPLFRDYRVIEYLTPVKYETWEQYAAKYAGKSYNTRYTEADVRADDVRRRFLELGEHKQFRFEMPKRVSYLARPVPSPAS
ncbi:MAG: class I SAM-dependent methyltransferase [Granulosicoccus sp.]|nr:class I SAM-dependent methyltransferase [Granulosicoccus sp.]